MRLTNPMRNYLPTTKLAISPEGLLLQLLGGRQSHPNTSMA